MPLPVRKILPHEVPRWIDSSRERYFVTISCHARGQNQLCTAKAGTSLLESIRFRHEKTNWFVHLFLLMPDHVHAILSFPPEKDIQSTISAWKNWTAKNPGIAWQRDFFEHRLRSSEELSEKWSYIRSNPVRAGLVADAGLWPWSLQYDAMSNSLVSPSENL